MSISADGASEYMERKHFFPKFWKYSCNTNFLNFLIPEIYYFAKRETSIKIPALYKWVILVCNFPLEISFPVHLGFQISKLLAPQPPAWSRWQLFLSYMNSNCKTQFFKGKWWHGKILSVISEQILQIDFEYMLHKPQKVF